MTITADPIVEIAARLRLRKDHAAAVEELVSPVEDAFARALLRIIRQALAKVAPALVAAAPPHIDLNGLEGLSAAWLNELPALTDQLAEVHGAGAMAVQNADPDAVRRAARAGRDVQGVTQQRALDYMATATNRLVGASDYLWESVRTQLSAGIAAGEGVEQLSARVQHAMDTSETRARTIARTETIGALNAGSIDGAKAMGADGPQTKEWLATDDDRTRDDHFEADGQQQPIDDPFDVGGEPLMFPGDPDGDPAQTINCRCTLIYVDEPAATDTTTDEQPAPDAPQPSGDTIEEPPLHPRDQAAADLRSSRDDFRSLFREVNGIDPNDQSPVAVRFGVDEPYRYSGPQEVRENDLVRNAGGDTFRVSFASPDEPLVATNGEVTTFSTVDYKVAYLQWDDLTLIERAPAEAQALTSEQAASLERVSAQAGRTADDEITRRLEERGLPGEMPTTELEKASARFDALRTDLVDAIKDGGAFPSNPNYVAIKEERSQLSARMVDLVREQRAWRESYADEVRAMLDEVRGTGDNKLAFNAISPTAGHVVDEVSTFYPNEWVEASSRGGSFTLDQSPNRSFYNPGMRLMEVPQGGLQDADTIEVATHELAHRMEMSVDGIRPVERGFFERRTEGESSFRLMDRFPDKSYDPREVAFEDKFATPYIGKDYGGLIGVGTDSPHELLSMGVEGVLSPLVSEGRWNAYVREIMVDIDYRRFVLGLLFSA